MGTQGYGAQQYPPLPPKPPINNGSYLESSGLKLERSHLSSVFGAGVSDLRQSWAVLGPPSSSSDLPWVSFKHGVWPAIRQVSGSIRAVRGILRPGHLCLLSPPCCHCQIHVGTRWLCCVLIGPSAETFLGPSPLSWRGQGPLCPIPQKLRGGLCWF